MSLLAYTLDLTNESHAIQLYEAHHANPFPEVAEHWRDVGCNWCKIFRHGLRLVILIDLIDDRTQSTPWKPEIAERMHQWDELMKGVQIELHDSHLANPEKMGKWTRMQEIYTFEK